MILRVFIILLCIISTSCLIVKNPTTRHTPTSIEEPENNADKNPKKVYTTNQIQAVRKLFAEAIYNDFNPDILESSLRSALFNNISTTVLIANNLDILSIAIDPRIGPYLSKEFKSSFEKISQVYHDLKNQNLLKKLDFTNDINVITTDVSTRYVEAAIHSLPDIYFTERDAAIEELIKNYDFSEINTATQSLTTIPVPDDLGSTTDFFRDILKFYFKEQHPEDKRRILSSLLKNTQPNAKTPELARALAMGAGPILQKYLQKLSDLLTTSSKPLSEETKDLKIAFDVVKDGLMPNPKKETQRNFLEIKRRTQNRVSLETIQSLGQGSIGVALLVKIQNGKKTSHAVYKELRSNIKEIVNRESLFFMKIAEKNHLEKAVEKKLGEIYQELNFEQERSNLLLADKYYNQSPLFHEYLKKKPQRTVDFIKAVTLIDIPPSPHYLAMQVAQGVSLKSILTSPQSSEDKTDSPTPPIKPMDLENLRKEKIRLLITTQMMNELVEKWVMVGLFLGKDGIIHGDLHPGNIFIDMDLDWYLKKLDHTEISDINFQLVRSMMHAKGNELRQKLTLIDFGIMPTMSKKERSGLVNVLVAAFESHSAEGFVQGLEMISSEVSNEFKANPTRRKDIVDGIHREFSSNSPDFLASIVTFLGTQKFNTPHIFVNFGDAMLVLENSFKSIKAKMRRLDIYDDDMESYFIFKKILAQTIATNISWFMSGYGIDKLLHFIRLNKIMPIAALDAPALNTPNLKAMICKTKEIINYRLVAKMCR